MTRTNRCSLLVPSLVAAMLFALSGCGGGEEGRANMGQTRNRYFVDVSNGELITAHTVGREPMIIRNQRAIPDPPRMPDRETVAAARPETSPTTANDGDIMAGGLNDSADAGTTNTSTPPAQANGARSASNANAGATTAPLPDVDISQFEHELASSNVPKVVWSILLKSFPEGDHRTLAAAAAGAFQQAEPKLRGGLWTHTTEKGTMVLYGNFDTLDAAQDDLQWVKSVEVQGQRPYATAHMARISIGGEAQTQRAQLHPLDLRNVRRQAPNVDTLYTVDVAAWMSDQNDPRSWPLCKRAAEAYARQLREAGFDAWFFHNESTQISSVTVGRFDHTAINTTSGFYSATLTRVMEQFPKRLVNGEEFIDPQTGKPQTAKLVQVPK